jgi:hypothetical protein
MTRIVGLHSLRTPLISIIGFFGETIAPMVNSLEHAASMKFIYGFLAALTLGSDFDTVPLTPITKDSLTNPKLSFNSPDGLSRLKMFFIDEFLNEGFISKFNVNIQNWLLSTITTVDIIPYSGELCNIEVEKDESYVADNIIVHNCRSIMIPAMKPLEDILGVSGVPEPPPSTKSAFSKTGMSGQISDKTTRDKWLKSVGTSGQNQILGPRRAQLWRDGKVTVKDLVSPKNGQVLTLKELREKIEEDRFYLPER